MNPRFKGYVIRTWSFSLAFLYVVFIFRQMARLCGPAPEFSLGSLGVPVERVPVSQACQSNMEVEFNRPVASHALEVTPVAGRMRHCLQPGSDAHSWEQWAELALYRLGWDWSVQRGYNISVLGHGGGRWPWIQVILSKLNPDQLFTLLTSANFSDSEMTVSGPPCSHGATAPGLWTLLFLVSSPPLSTSRLFFLD